MTSVRAKPIPLHRDSQRRKKAPRTKRPWREVAHVREWRDAIRHEYGPPSPITRLVLLALSLWIKSGERSCWPSQKLLARQTALSLRSVKHHLELADDDGWILRTRRHRSPDGWGYHVYEPTIPVVEQGATGAPSQGPKCR